MEMVVEIKDDNGVMRTLGTVENGVFRGARRKSAHFFVKKNAWGLDQKVVDTFLIRNDVHTIVLYDEEEQKTYVTTPAVFKEKATLLQFGAHRPQYFLSVYEWQVFEGGLTNDDIQQRLHERCSKQSVL